MQIPDVSTPVVLLRSMGVSGLGITRSLGSWGVPVYSVEAGPLTPAFYSRYSRGRFRWDLDRHPAQESIVFLRSIAQKIGRRPVLLPTRDQAAIFVAEHAEELRPWFKFARQSPDLVHSLCSKQEMCELARPFGVPLAETRFPNSRSDVVSFGAMAKFPVLIKAIDGDRMVKVAHRRMFVVKNANELLQKYDEINDPENIILQDYIPGPEEYCWIFHGCFDQNSRCLAAFTGQKLRQCRAYGGDTCLGVYRKNPIIEETAIRFLKGIGYSGIVDMCLRYDARDGLYKVLDVNPRIGANSRIFVSNNGLDLARIYYLDMTGQSRNAEPIREGRTWQVEDYDIVSCIRYWLDGNLGVHEWIASLRTIDERGFTDFRDPLPAIARLIEDLAEFLKRFKKPGEPTQGARPSEARPVSLKSRAA
jgi:D-aspartate ligase